MMKPGPRLELRQGQSLVMTQQLQQSIKLLQATSQELRAFVEQELEKNPFLSQEEPEGEQPDAESVREDSEPREADFGGDNDFSSEWNEGGDDNDAIERDYLSSSQINTHSADYGDEDTRSIDDNPS